MNGAARVVAIGSSSTAGNGASSPGAGYVAVMQSLLTGRTDVQFVVINAGVPGNSLADVQNRLERDALSLNPRLVILQVGVNDALVNPSQAGVDAFRSSFASIVSQIKSSASIVLVNGQYFERQPAFYESYMVVMNEVASQQHVPMFDRYYLMKNAIMSRQYSFSDLLASDSFHPNDTMHSCMGKVLSELVLSRTVR